MHRLRLQDGTYRQSRFLRWARTIGYAMIGSSGVLLLLSGVFIPAFGTVAVAMAWFLAVGGATSSGGAATGLWVGEFVGLPLLMSSFVIFGLLTLRASFDATPYIASANMSLLGGFAAIMATRWRVVLAVYRTANRFTRPERPAGA